MRLFLRRWLLRRRKTVYATWADFQRRNGYHPGFQENTWAVIATDKDQRIKIGRTLLSGPETARITRIIPNFEETIADIPYWSYIDIDKTARIDTPGVDRYATQPMKL